MAQLIFSYCKRPLYLQLATSAEYDIFEGTSERKCIITSLDLITENLDEVVKKINLACMSNFKQT